MNKLRIEGYNHLYFSRHITRLRELQRDNVMFR